MSGKGKITCAKLKEAAEHKAAVYKEREVTLKVIEDIIAIRRNEEEAETQYDHGLYPA
jgi:hypothetical protein